MEKSETTVLEFGKIRNNFEPVDGRERLVEEGQSAGETEAPEIKGKLRDIMTLLRNYNED